MKLRNKKTGEITLHYNKGRKTIHFKRLEDLEDWEDYEEPNIYYFIDIHGQVKQMEDLSFDWQDKMKQIGNYFESEEEAEKAVEKLKALKRLKDKGFKFSKWTIPEEPKTTHIKLALYAEMEAPDSPYDLDLLFGGEK